MLLKIFMQTYSCSRLGGGSMDDSHVFVRISIFNATHGAPSTPVL